MSGTKLRLNVFDRKGVLHDELHLPGTEVAGQTSCMQIVWDKRSKKLAGGGVGVQGPESRV